MEDRPVVLVVEDVPPLCRALARLLGPLGQVDLEDGQADSYAACLQAIKRITRKPPAVVVVDGLDGYGPLVADIAREEGVPVVAYTAEPGIFRRLGVPVVVKPSTAELVEAVRAALGDR